MSVEQGFIEFIFQQRGASGVKSALEGIQRDVLAGTRSFKDFEKSIEQALRVDKASGVQQLESYINKLAQGVRDGSVKVGELDRALSKLSRIAPEAGSKLAASFDNDKVIAFARSVADVEAQIRKVNSARNTNLKADALGIESPVAMPAPRRDQLDEFVRYSKAANASVVSDTESAYRQMNSSYQRLIKSDQEKAFENRKREIGEIGALEERAAQQRARVNRAQIVVDQSKSNNSLEGLQQQAAATQLLADRTVALRSTESQLSQARGREAAAEQSRRSREVNAVAKSAQDQANAYEKLKAARNNAATGAASAESARADREEISRIGEKEAAQRRYNQALREEQAARALIKQGAALGGAQGVAMQTQGYNDLSSAVRKSESALNAMHGAQQGIISQRYALYDIANIYGLVGATLAGAGAYATVVGAQFETAFTSVERTLDPMEATANGVTQMKQSLIQLQQQVPLTFAELSKIATIGNQMGIAEEDLMGFTGTIARFASVSGMSIDEVTKAFGGFMAQTGLAPKYLENLGSSVALVGIKSNATEAEILSVMREIGRLGTRAGLSADEIVGLAGTLASLRIPAERSRGALTTFFGTLNTAVAEGGESLANFSAIIGKTSSEIQEMVLQGDGASVMRGFLDGLNSRNTVEATRALEELGLAQLRVEDTFAGLASRIDLFDEYMGISKQGFIEGAELNRQYAMTLDDLSSQWTIFINGLNSVIATVTGDAVPGLAGLLGMVNKLIYGFQEFLVKHPWARYLLAFSAALVAVIGVMAIVAAATFRARASVLAFSIATQHATAKGIQGVGVFRTLAGSLFGVGQGAAAGSRGLRMFRAALVSTGVGALLVGVGFLAEKFMDMGGGAEDAAISLDEYNSINKQLEEQSGGAADGVGGLGKSLDKTGDSAAKAAEKIRTLVDYASDLSGIFNRSFDLRFGVDEALDDVTELINSIKKANADAAQQILDLKDKFKDLGQSITDSRLKLRELKAELNGLGADLSMQKYFLQIAMEYGDDKRAEQLRAEIAKTEAEIASKKGDVAKENDKINKYEKERLELLNEIERLKKQISNKALKGDTEEALKNRDAILSLVGGYREQLIAMAEAGASQEELAAKARELKRDFLDQATQLGFNRAELGKYAAAFDDMSTIIGKAPRNITPILDRPDLGPAELALAEFFEKAKADSITSGVESGSGYSDGFDSGVGGLEIPEPEYDAKSDGEDAGRDFVTGMVIGVGKWIGEVVRAVSETLSKGVGAVFGKDGVLAKLSRGENPMLPGIFKWFSDAGIGGSKKMTDEVSKGVNEPTWMQQMMALFSTSIASGWLTSGEESGEKYNKGVGNTADPDGEVARKLPSGKGGGGGGGGGGMMSMSRMGNLGEIGADEFNSKLGGKVNPDGSIRPKIEKSRGPLSTLLASISGTGAFMYNQAMGNKVDAPGVLSRDANSSRGVVSAGMDGVGRSGGSGYNIGLGSSADTGAKISSNIRAGQGVASFQASTMGEAIGASISGGISWILDSLLGSGSKTRKIVKNITGFSGGGYTGSGHWLQPAGIVHAGEYVIPKRHVDQRTKLPDISYVQSLHSGQRARPKMGYATGGAVMGGAGAGGAIPVQVVNAIELGARSIHTLSNQRGGGGGITEGMIGSAASRSFQRDAMIGAG